MAPFREEMHDHLSASCLTSNHSYSSIIATGAFKILLRLLLVFLFARQFESPVYLPPRCRQSVDVEVTHSVAYHNNGQKWITKGIFYYIGGFVDAIDNDRLSVKGNDMTQLC